MNREELLKTAKPILFNTPMVKAILDGRKTQTRRVLKDCDTFEIDENEGLFNLVHNYKCSIENVGLFSTEAKLQNYFASKYSKYKKGDILIPLVAIPNLNGNYALDVYGNVWSKGKGEWRKLKASPTSMGYLAVSISVNGKKKTKTIHRLMAESYYRPLLDGEVARHLDNNKLNNHIDNIDIGTVSDNMQDRTVAKTHNGETHNQSKLTQKEVDEIRTSTKSQRQLAKIYKVSQNRIWSIKNNHTWKDETKKIKINMLRHKYARIFLKVTDVRVERLQDISTQDILQESISNAYNNGEIKWDYAIRSEWENLWNSTSKDGNKWDDNPYVFVYEFERVE